MGVSAALGIDEITSRRSGLWRKLFAEFVGVLFIVLLGCGSTTGGWGGDLTDTASVFRISFAFGFSVASVVEAFGHTSGGHVNPAITIAMLVVRRIKLIPAVLYIAAQLLGGIAGAAILSGLTPPELGTKLGANALNHGVRPEQGLGVELMITLLLVLVVFAVTDEHRMEIKGAASLTIGVAVTVAHLFAIKYTGCGLNPARVFGPAVLTGIWDDQWAYWVGEIAGGVLAAILYVAFFSADESGITTRFFKTMRGSASISDSEQRKEVMPVSAVSVERTNP